MLLEESMGSPIYYQLSSGIWKMADKFNPAPGLFAFVTDKLWIAEFYANFHEVYIL